MNREDALAALVSLPETMRISVASLKPTDVIVIECDDYVSSEMAERMRHQLQPIWPNNKIVVFGKGARIKVAS